MKSGSLKNSVFSDKTIGNILLIGNRKGIVYVTDFNSTSSEEMTWSVQQSMCRRKLVVAQEVVSLELQGYESFGEEKI